MNRRGMALLVVLWMLVALSVVTGVALAGVRLGAKVSVNRKLLARAAWAAEACVAIYRSDAADSLGDGRMVPMGDLPRIELGPGISCRFQVEDPHTRVNANTAGHEALVRVLGDTTLAGLVIRRRPWPAVEAIAAAPGVSQRQGELVQKVLTVRGEGRINLNLADLRVLQATPGISEEVASRIVSRRSAERPFTSTDEVLGVLPPADRQAVLARYTEFVHVATTRPSVLVARATGLAGSPPLAATMTVTLVPAGNRVAVVRWEAE
jgi:type II secretory pathway component PulK